MAFHTNKENQLKWNRFLSSYKERLINLGILEISFRSEQDWFYFIEHLYDFNHPELLNLEDWSTQNLKPLLPIFEKMHEEGFYAGESSGVLSWLRAKIK